MDGIAQETGAERRDMKVMFVADHKHQDLRTWGVLKNEVMPGVTFAWERPNELNHPRPYFVPTPRLVNLLRFGKLVLMGVLSRL